MSLHVDLICRSHGGDAAPLLLLSQSVALFWPHHWGFIVVLDADAPDAHLIGMLEQRAQVFLETAPPRWQEFPALRGRPAGYMRAQWSMFHLDRYSTAEYIAFVDSDVSFFTWITPSLLFRNNLPIVRAMTVPYFWLGVQELGWPWVAEFMVGFPMLLRREVFRQARAFLHESMNGKVGQMPDFDEAFYTLAIRLQNRTINNSFSFDVHPLPCAQTLLGHAAFLLHETRYAWSILSVGDEHAQLTVSESTRHWIRRILHQFDSYVELSPSHKCPALMPAAHLGYWINDKVRDHAALSASSVGYHLAAASLMLLGRCGDFDDYNRDLGQCASVRCKSCPGALYRTITLGEEQRRFRWGSLPLQSGCTSVHELAVDYSKEWASHRSSHALPTFGGGIFASSDGCRRFCELIGGKALFTFWGIESHYAVRESIDALAPDWKCMLGSALPDASGVMCPIHQ